MNLSGLDLVPLNRISCIINFDPLCGLELARGDGRLAVLWVLAIKLLLIYFYREEALSTVSFYLQKIHRTTDFVLLPSVSCSHKTYTVASLR